MEVKRALQAFLQTKKVPPTQAWLESILPTLKLNTPIVALQKTALFRMLATDITESVDANAQACLTAAACDPSQQQHTLSGEVLVQVLDIEDIGRSRWSQVETIEMQERGELTRGREVIRVVPEEDDGATPGRQTQQTTSHGPHKLLLQDAKGQKVYAMELETVRGIDVSLSIGAKLVLRGTTAARGLLLLTPANTELLGGKVDAWDKRWRESRKQSLKEKAGWVEGVN